MSGGWYDHLSPTIYIPGSTAVGAGATAVRTTQQIPPGSTLAWLAAVSTAHATWDDVTLALGYSDTATASYTDATTKYRIWPVHGDAASATDWRVAPNRVMPIIPIRLTLPRFPGRIHVAINNDTATATTVFTLLAVAPQQAPSPVERSLARIEALLGRILRQMQERET